MRRVPRSVIALMPAPWPIERANTERRIVVICRSRVQVDCWKPVASSPGSDIGPEYIQVRRVFCSMLAAQAGQVVHCQGHLLSKQAGDHLLDQMILT